MEALSFDNILGEQEIDTLFSTPEDNPQPEETPKEEPTPEEPGDEKPETTEKSPKSLFDEGEPSESVGSEDIEEKDKEDAPPTESGGTSPDENFYSSIANALAVDGIFPNLDDETIKSAVDAETFSELMEKEINARLDEKQLRISKALENGVEPSEIRKYENTLQYLSQLTETVVAEESEKGEQLRRQLIFQDFINKGYSPEKAQKFTDRTIDAGTDLEDAKEALQSNREFFQKHYDKLLREAQEVAEADKRERKKEAEKLKKSIMEDANLMGDMEIPKDVRKKVFDAISAPVYRDSETGEYMTALQKYEAENHSDFIKYVGLFFSLTNGFKDFKSFTKAEVKKEMKKGLKELEQTLNNTRRNSNGSLKMVTNQKDDPESFYSKEIKLAL